jgi:hypothetical protein
MSLSKSAFWWSPRPDIPFCGPAVFVLCPTIAHYCPIWHTGTPPGPAGDAAIQGCCCCGLAGKHVLSLKRKKCFTDSKP